jgi:FkbM family methyltransferase
VQLKKLCGEHTIDVDLLPECPLVLDAGCRSFNFCEEILQLRPKARIIAVDPGPDIDPPVDWRIRFQRFAITEAGGANVWLKKAGFESVTSRTPVDGWDEVPTVSLHEVLKDCGPYFDLIKFDIEGSEFAILENWSGRCATQINVEFHDNRASVDGLGLPKSYFDKLLDGPLKDYRVVQNEPDYLGTHADALFVLKECR